MPRVTVDRVMADRRAASFTKRSIKTSAKEAGLRMALSMVDLTTLEGKDSEEKVRSLCVKALQPDVNDDTLPHVAAVCVYPTMVEIAVDELKGTGVNVASVATGFPSGQYPLEVRLDDTRRAVDAGADEIDMVISRGSFLAGWRDEVADEIAQIKDACAKAHLKVILETGELETYDLVREASDLAIDAGADFIKTSTGKVSPAATMGVTLVMLEAVRDHYLRTGVKIGVKPAGGIRTAKQSLHYLVMVKETLGDDWLTPELFRFGASSLTNDLLLQLGKLRTGHYMSNRDYAEA
ncbi:MAG: deoxyribose-phosphate aldolase [Planctomycetota bacterium]